MRLLHSIAPITFGFVLALAAPLQVPAKQPTDSGAARYLRTLFDATLPLGGDLSSHCADIQAIGHFAAGRLWQALSDAEQQKFNRSFCKLGAGAIQRLRKMFPGLTLTLGENTPAPQDMMTVHTLVTAQDGRQWAVDWLIAEAPDQPYLADLRVLGISLGIFLRSLAALEWSDRVPASPSADDILRPWTRALDRALSAESGAAPR
jgi:ABC-type transporter MlaC component